MSAFIIDTKKLLAVGKFLTVEEADQHAMSQKYDFTIITDVADTCALFTQQQIEAVYNNMTGQKRDFLNSESAAHKLLDYLTTNEVKTMGTKKKTSKKSAAKKAVTKKTSKKKTSKKKAASKKVAKKSASKKTSKKKAAAKSTGGTGYGKHRAGSRKGTAHEWFDKNKPTRAEFVAFCAGLPDGGIAATTASSWFQSFK